VRTEFQWALKEAGFNLTKTEQDQIFRFFDKNFQDRVSYVEFLSFFRGEYYNAQKKAAV
jgi:Ca2+-binding EF-hand superfamily protein